MQYDIKQMEQNEKWLMQTGQDSNLKIMEIQQSANMTKWKYNIMQLQQNANMT